MRCTLYAVLLAACGEVSAPPGADSGPGAATITYTSQLASGQPGNTGLVAFQDGDGPWQVVTGNAGVYTMTITGRRYGILTACKRGSDGSAFISLDYLAVSDGTMRYGTDGCASAVAPRVTITGTVSGATSSDTVVISDGVSNTSAGPPGSWTLEAQAGAGTLIAMRLSGSRPVGMVVQRAQFAGGSAFPVDFTQQFAPAEGNLALDPNAGGVTMFTSYLDDAGGEHRIDSAMTAVDKYRVVPADRAGNGISVLHAIGTTQTGSRSLERAFRTPATQTVALPSTLVLSGPPRKVAAMPYPIFEIAVPQRPGAGYYAVSYQAFTGSGPSQNWSVLYSAAWVDAGNDLISRLPDLSSVPGWQPDFALTTVAMIWEVAVGTGPARRLPGAAPYRSLGVPAAMPLDGEEVTRSSAFGAL